MASKLQNYARPLPCGALTLSGWLGQRYELTWRKNLLALDWDGDFLRPFQEKNSKLGFVGSYVGLGKTLDALTRYAAHTQDSELLALRRHVLDTLLACQEPDGYLGIFPPETRISRPWDVHELAYILLALVSDWRFFSEARSFEAAKRLGDYLLRQLATGPLPTEFNRPTNSDIALELTMLGLDRALLALHHASGDERYLDFCRDRLHLETWKLPIIEGRHGALEGHAYAYLCRCLAQLELREINDTGSLTSQSYRVIEHLTSHGGLLVNGTFSIDECWDSTQQGAGDIGETCATAYWIRLCAKLLCNEGSGRYGDLMERAIYNALFAAQSPDGRHLRYFVPFEGPRVYWNPDTYCCPSNFRRILAELPELVYFATDAGFLVNLYTASEARLSLASGNTVTVTQETDYPNSGSVALHLAIAEPEQFTLSLRIPAWCSDFSLSVSGQSVEGAVMDGLVHLDRIWRAGDRVELEMKMPWRLLQGEGLQEGRAALLRGPVLFCVNPKRNGMTSEALSTCRVDYPESPIPQLDATLRTNGMSCACGQNHSKGSLLFTEFADPGGEATYLSPAVGTTLKRDELLST